ncbi:MAG: glycerophosphodiester phosphodiesterase family protein [Bacteroidales bacterium]|nr:glycerophosphodiester phosphodiesterase family protein [Bacteroidales bacterium]
MKRFILLAALAAVALSAISCGKAGNGESAASKAMSILKDPASKKILVAAHRGDWRNYPENSIPAIESLIKMGVDMMELDVKMTSDGVLVVCHDQTVDRTTNGKGLISTYTLDSLKTLRLKRSHGVTTDSLRMPTLKEALLVCKDKILVNVDQGGKWLPEVLEVAREVGCVDQIIFKTSGAREATAAPMRACGEAGVVYMPVVSVSKDGASPTIDSYLDGGEMPLIFEVCFSKDSPETEAYLKALQEAGSKVWVNSIWGSLCGYLDDDRAFQSPEEAEAAYGRLVDLGFKVFQSDRPEYLLDYLRKRGLHD